MTERASLSELLAATKGQLEQTNIEGVTGKPEQAKPPLSERIIKAEATRVVSKAKTRATTRSAGKNNNPDFHKLTVYIPMKTRRAVAMKIASDGGGMELSTLVTTLLDGWTASRSDG